MSEKLVKLQCNQSSSSEGVKGINFHITGNTLEGDVSDVFALDQPTSLFARRKVTRMSP